MSGLFYFKIRCMTIEDSIITIRNELIRSISGLDGWFDCGEILVAHKPSTGGWSVGDVLEHVMLANEYLLLLIDQGTVAALQQTEKDRHNGLYDHCLILPSLKKVEIDKLFHAPMAPTGKKLLSEVRSEIRDQLNRCLIHLELLSKGEGVLRKTSMLMSGMGALDVYECIYLLALHARTHLNELEEIKNDFNNAMASV